MKEDLRLKFKKLRNDIEDKTLKDERICINFLNSKLYQNAVKTGASSFSGKLANFFCGELFAQDEYAFIRDCAEFRELMDGMGC